MRASRNERTSKSLASKAGQYLDALATCPDKTTATFQWWDGKAHRIVVITAKTAKGGFASLLTQARNKGPIEATARPKKAGRVGRK